MSSHRKGSPTTRSVPLRVVWCLAIAMAVATATTRTDGPLTASLVLLAGYVVVSALVHRRTRPECRGAHRAVQASPSTYGGAVAGR